VSPDPSEGGTPELPQGPSGEQPTQPLPPVPPQPGPPVPPAAASPSSSDLCPNCHARMAPDQRYCLSCGNRRGEPRLPFMDAVTFMDSMHGPPPSAAAAPPPSPPRQRFSSGTTLVAGVATLVLAIGVGVLIGQSGDEGSQPVASQAPIVVKTEGGGGGSTETEGEAADGKGKNGGGKDKGGKGEIDTGSSGTSEGAEEFIKPKSGVKLAAPETKVGEKCDKDVAGCSDSGKFDGSFFGE